MTTHEDAAQLLYGASHPADEPEVPQADADKGTEGAESDVYAPAPPAAERDDVPDAVKALRASENGLYEAIPMTGLEGIDAQEAGRVAQDIGASGEDRQQFETLAAQALAASGEQHAAWLAESMRLIETGVISQGDLALARKLTSRDPRLAQYLDHTGLTNHPVIVRRVVELARSERARGRLK